MPISFRKILRSEDGFVLGASILVSAILILAGVFAVWKSSTEVQMVRNESDMIREFYNAEAGVIDALENYNAGPTQWMTTEFLTDGPTFAGSRVNYDDAASNPIATIEVRCIENTGANIDELSEAANRLPQQPHISPPPKGSGYSLKYFEVRRYGITATSSAGNTQVQVGAWKVFNKF